MKSMLQVLLAGAFLLAGIGVANADNADDFKKIISGKTVLSKGGCYFQNEGFKMFASGSWIAPKGSAYYRVPCVVLADTPVSTNPMWLVMLDAGMHPMEVIFWKDGEDGKPDDFKSIWRSPGKEEPEEKAAPVPGETPVIKPPGTEI